MKFAFALLPIAAALGFVQAGLINVDEGFTMVAPVPVTKLVCDGATFKCTASLKYGDDKWVAEWTANVFHSNIFGYAAEEENQEMTSMAPVPVTSLTCDGSTFKCTAKLKYGDGKWLAEWGARVFHQALKLFDDQEFDNAMAPVPVSKLTCDGSTFKCTADLVYGDGNWKAEWTVHVYHTQNGV